MDRYTARRWLKGIGVLLALLLLGSMISFHANDPSLTNLRYPHGGVQNLLGLPGALLGGSLVELLGASALGIPLLLLNWVVLPRGRRRPWSYPAFGAGALLIAPTLHGLVSQTTAPGLNAPGIAGLAGSTWVLATTGLWVGLLLLVPALGYALTRVLYVPLLNTALQDARTFGSYFVRQGRAGLRTGREGAREVRATLAETRRAGWSALHGAARELAARVLRALGRLPLLGRAMPSAAGWAQAAAPSTRPGLAGGNGGAGMAGRGLPLRVGDAFDAWFAAPEQPGRDGKAAGKG